MRKLAILPIVFFSDKIFVSSQKGREILRRIASKKIHKTIIGTNIKVFSRNKVKRDLFTISYLGSVYSGKGIEKMLSIWKQVKNYDNNDKIRFKIIGDVGTDSNNLFKEYHEKVWKLIDKYNLRNSICVTEFLSDEDFSKAISDYDVATLFYEDGLTLRRGCFLAYLAHGVPIITSKGDDESNLLFPNCSGVFMIDPELEAIKAIVKLLNSSEENIDNRKSSNIAHSSFFDWNEISLAFLKEYHIIK